MNVLITSVSSKASLVKWFRSAGPDVRVIGCDSDPFAPAQNSCHVFARALSMSDSLAFEEFLTDLLFEHDIGLIVPTRHGELMWFAERRERWPGVLVAVSSPETIELCDDKSKTSDAIRTLGLKTPRVWSECSPPWFVKNLVGAGNGGFRLADTHDANVEANKLALSGVRVEEFIDGKEYSVDYFADGDGNVISVVPRTRDRVRNGESVVSTTCYEPAMMSQACAIAKLFGIRYHAVLQCIVDASGAPVWTDVNPRYGGASSVSFLAGCPSPHWLVQLARGEWVSRHGAFKHVRVFRTTDDSVESEGVSG